MVLTLFENWIKGALLEWEPRIALETGVAQTYQWIEDQVKQRLAAPARR